MKNSDEFMGWVLVVAMSGGLLLLFVYTSFELFLHIRRKQ